MSKRYSLNTDFDDKELSRLKHHAHLFGYKSVRDFAKHAILEKMVTDLTKLPPDKRKTTETVLNQLIANDTDSLV